MESDKYVTTNVTANMAIHISHANTRKKQAMRMHTYY